MRKKASYRKNQMQITAAETVSLDFPSFMSKPHRLLDIDVLVRDALSCKHLYKEKSIQWTFYQ